MYTIAPNLYHYFYREFFGGSYLKLRIELFLVDK